MKYEQTSLCEYGVSFWTDGWCVPCERESYLTRKEWEASDKAAEESLTVSPEAWNRRFHASIHRMLSDYELDEIENKARRLDERVRKSMMVPQEFLDMKLGSYNNRIY